MPVSTSYLEDVIGLVSNILPPSGTAGVPAFSPVSASAGFSTGSATGLSTGRIQIFVTGRLMTPSAVFSETTRTTPSSPGNTSRMRAIRQRVGGWLLSRIITRLPGLISFGGFHHLILPCSCVRYSDLHRFQ
uniref:(northern house mosquito) hypothetical protein n=1 Tax=Culex pipiens TaxID=7175 RepID=A0A8D8BRJ3_CULPI